MALILADWFPEKVDTANDGLFRVYPTIGYSLLLRRIFS